MVQYEQVGRQDVFDTYNWNTKDQILDNVSRVMSIFPISIGLSENLDLEFCQRVWLQNFYYSP
jgi:dynactin complex subunit